MVFIFYTDINTDINRKMDKIQDTIIRSFSKYLQQMSSQYSTTNRMSKFFIKMMTLRSLESDIVEELFFKIIGQVDVINVIPYIWKLGGAGTTSVTPSSGST